MAPAYLDTEHNHYHEFSARLRRGLIAYLPSLEEFFYQWVPDLESIVKTLKEKKPDPALAPLAYVEYCQRRQQAIRQIIVCASFILSLAALAIVASAIIVNIFFFLPFIAPIGVIVTAGVLLSIAIPFFINSAVKIFQKISNWFSSRVKVAEKKSLTDRELEKIGLKVGLTEQEITILKNNSKRLKNEELLTNSDLETLTCVTQDNQKKKKLRYYLGYSKEELDTLRKNLNLKDTSSLWYLRWKSASTESNQFNPYAYLKNSSHETLGNAIGTVVGGTIGALVSFCEMTFFGITLGVPTLLTQILCTAVFAKAGSTVGANTGESYTTNSSVNPNYPMPCGVKDINPADEKLLLSSRYITIAGFFGLFEMLQFFSNKIWNATAGITAAYSVAGIFSVFARFYFKNKRDQTETKNNESTEMFLSVKNIEDWDENDIEQATIALLHRREKYLAKLALLTPSNTVLMQARYYVGYLHKKISDCVDDIARNILRLGFSSLYWIKNCGNSAQAQAENNLDEAINNTKMGKRLAKGLVHLTLIPSILYVLSIAVGIVATLIKGISLLPVINKIYNLAADPEKADKQSWFSPGTTSCGIYRLKYTQKLEETNQLIQEKVNYEKIDKPTDEQKADIKQKLHGFFQPFYENKKTKKAPEKSQKQSFWEGLNQPVKASNFERLAEKNINKKHLSETELKPCPSQANYSFLRCS